MLNREDVTNKELLDDVEAVLHDLTSPVTNKLSNDTSVSEPNPCPQNDEASQCGSSTNQVECAGCFIPWGPQGKSSPVVLAEKGPFSLISDGSEFDPACFPYDLDAYFEGGPSGSVGLEGS